MPNLKCLAILIFCYFCASTHSASIEETTILSPKKKETDNTKYNISESCRAFCQEQFGESCFTPCAICKFSDKAMTILTCLFIIECIESKNEACFFCCPGIIASSPGLLSNSDENCFTPCYCSNDNGEKYQSCGLLGPMINCRKGENHSCCFFTYGNAYYEGSKCEVCAPIFAEYSDNDIQGGYCLGYGYGVDKKTNLECSCCLLLEHFRNETFKGGIQCAGIGCARPRNDEVKSCELSICHEPCSKVIDLIRGFR